MSQHSSMVNPRFYVVTVISISRSEYPKHHIPYWDDLCLNMVTAPAHPDRRFPPPFVFKNLSVIALPLLHYLLTQLYSVVFKQLPHICTKNYYTFLPILVIPHFLPLVRTHKILSRYISSLHINIYTLFLSDCIYIYINSPMSHALSPHSQKNRRLTGRV